MPEYPIIDYLDKTNGISIRKQIRKVTKHLGFGYANHKYDRRIKIYSIFGHKEVMPQAIKDTTSAIEFCLYLEKTYGEYWDIHQLKEYEDFDIIQVCQHSVPNGIAIYDALIRTGVLLRGLADRDTISFSEFQKEMENI